MKLFMILLKKKLFNLKNMVKCKKKKRKIQFHKVRHCNIPKEPPSSLLSITPFCTWLHFYCIYSYLILSCKHFSIVIKIYECVNYLLLDNKL